MAGVSAVGGQGLQLAAQYQAAALNLQRDAINLQGSLAIQLIQSATIADPASGQALDISV